MGGGVGDVGGRIKFAYSFIVGRHDRVLLTKFCFGDKIENEMGGACSAYRGVEAYTSIGETCGK